MQIRIIFSKMNSFDTHFKVVNPDPNLKYVLLALIKPNLNLEYTFKFLRPIV